MTVTQGTPTTQTELYEQDFYLWIEQTAQLLREGRLSELDISNLLEEVEAMGRSEKQALESNLEILLMHLLKYQYQPQKRSNSWLYTIFEHRKRLQKQFKSSPSLKRYFQEVFGECYQTARKMASLETGLNITVFPSDSPFNVEETLDFEFLPPDASSGNLE